jgi:hypothetical protein
MAGAAGAAGAPDDIALMLETYTSWSALSDHAVDISAEIFGLCRLPTSAETAFATSVHGKHALRDFANESALAGIQAHGAGGFAVGSAIVKEKYAQDAASGNLVLAALGAMVKRPSGFDSSAGDWDFVYWTRADGTTHGGAELATCASCHASQSAVDYVFLDEAWRK